MEKLFSIMAWGFLAWLLLIVIGALMMVALGYYQEIEDILKRRL